ncbi:Glutathione S-transferase U9 [Morella rubra]|uniref:Glutathione S-transferase n=1 Tax=Morella rubra TaxID=262757 RepID=A0A6A1UGD6_9ROSI|nr:Glutathione S-transferase U9 [Morella rubra]KAB1199356.1 Glutathione S-transferase U9 [Morella rubra]
MEEQNKVMLHGTWFSPFVKTVELALKVKGIPYEYVEEDLKNKSPLLLKYNPVHKKVPVLVHNGTPICESLVILEYIDETWTNIGPRLLPQDPYKRAQVRFWSSFLQQQLLQTLFAVIKSDGEAQENAVKELLEKLKVLEEGIKNFPDGISFIDHENLGFLDIVLLTMFGTYKVQEQVIGFKVIDPEKSPLLVSWLSALFELPVVKEGLPPHEKLVGLLQYIRQNALNSAPV